MKILHLSSGDHVQSGMHTALFQVVSLIRHSGFSHAMVCGNLTAANATKDQMDQTLVGTFYTPLLDCGSYVRFQLFLRAFQPDLIQVWSNKIARFLWPKPRCPVVTYLGSHPDRRRACRLQATTDAFIVPSEDMEMDLRQKGFVHHPVHVMKHYADTTGASPYFRHDFLGGEAPLILAGGRLVLDKGFDLLLQVCAKLQSPFHLLIAGTGTEEETLKKMTSSLRLEDKVTFLGWRDDFQRLLATADIVAMPSRYEPFGLVLLEAMAQKSAVVVSDVSGPRSILAHNDGAAIMLPLDDQAAWVRSLEALLTHQQDRQYLAKSGYDYVRQHYGIEKARNDLMDFYQRLV
jgi:glycosyltransferase involved in cell wall biosynthesis